MSTKVQVNTKIAIIFKILNIPTTFDIFARIYEKNLKGGSKCYD